MKAWNICYDGQLASQFQMQDNKCDENFLPPNLCSFTKIRTKSTLKTNTARVEKTSLKVTRNQQKPKENCDANSQSTKTSPTIYVSKGTPQNPNAFSPKTQEKPIPEKMIGTKMNPQKFNPQVSQAYCMSPPLVRVSSQIASSCNVKINYINPVQSIRFERDSKKIEPQVLQSCRTLRRMNTEPGKFCFEELTQQKNTWEIKQQVPLCRSMDQQSIKKSLKSTHNLHEIKCINAESIADSEEPQDEISIVISPMTDDFYLNKPDFNSEYWDERVNLFTYSRDEN